MSNWTTKKVEQQLRLAAIHSSRIPEYLIKEQVNHWPYFVRELMAAQVGRRDLTRNNTWDVDALTCIIRFLLWINEDEIKVVWLRAVGISWSDISQKLGVGITKLKKDCKLAHSKIAIYATMGVTLNRTKSGGRPSSKKWTEARIRIFERDNYICRYCGVAGLKMHCDHVIPVSKGGSSDDYNLVTSCQKCNLQKSTKIMSHFNTKVLKTGGDISRGYLA